MGDGGAGNVQGTTGAGDGGSHGNGGSTGDGGSGSGGAAAGRPCKRGIAYGHHSVADLSALSASVGWWYNGASVPDEELRGGDHVALDVELVSAFNEPNFFSQANLSAAEREAMPLLEADPDVFRYAWFSGRTEAIPSVDLLGASGELTALGALPHAERCSP